MARAWSDADIATLRRVAADGGSYTDAAALLGATRNQVAGKAHRESISFHGPARSGTQKGWDRLDPVRHAQRVAATIAKATEAAAQRHRTASQPSADA